MNFDCKGCGATHTFPDPEPKVVKEPCECGMTASVRETKLVGKYITIGVVTLILSVFGGCWLDQHYTLESIKEVKGEGWRIRENQQKSNIPFNTPEYEVVPDGKK